MKLNSKNLTILAIETSCDETSVAVVVKDNGVISVLSNIVSSQIDIHKQYGGVVPEIAARHHVKNIIPVIMEAMETAKVSRDEIDLIAVTAGPGLVTSLIVGVETAKTLSLAWGKPLMAVNHMYAHLAANFINNEIKFPAIALIVSGGHTELVLVNSFNDFKKIGQTIDDAAGEAFDKVAKMLALGYPGGPIVSAEADKFSIFNYQFSKIVLPRPMLNSGDFNFSFSGLKTAVLYATKKMTKEELKERTSEICYEFQEAVIETLVKKTVKAAENYGAKTVFMAGGVAANKKLREDLRQAVEKMGLDFMVPEFKYCTDNAGMIGIAAQRLAENGWPAVDNFKNVKADPNWELE